MNDQSKPAYWVMAMVAVALVLFLVVWAARNGWLGL